MKKLGIKYQIFLIALIPALLVDVFFTYTHFTNNVDQAYNLLQSKGQIIAKQLAGASEFNMLSGNYGQIQRLLNKTINTNAVIFASVYDENSEAIALSISIEYDPQKTANYFYYRLPIITQSIHDPDVFKPDHNYDEKNRIIGWVHLNISRKQLEKEKEKILYRSIFFFISILFIALILSAIISGGITRPIFKLLEHIKKVENGQLGEPIESLESNEIGKLQKGFNQMTEALLNNRNDLNDKVLFATKQLSDVIDDFKGKNSELKFAKDEAQNANKIKSIFLTNMSHEIRTPINGIKGFINLMSQSDLNPTQQRYADIILKSTNDLTDIISEILDFSKMESGKLQIVDDNFDLYETIQQARDLLFINVLSKNIDLILIIYSDTPRFVWGDKLRLKQVLLNLIGNAIKFTDEGEVMVRVTVEQQTESDVTILITVEDTGIGISKKDQENLFQAFSQVDTSTNRRFTGTGLGLVISKNLIRLMAGEISMQSKLGIGTKFSVRLPFLLTSSPVETDLLDHSNNKLALILSSRVNCLQEITSLFDGAKIATESMLISMSDSAESINSNIRKNLKHIDYLAIDLRHFNLNLNEILANISMEQTHMLVMHYDQTMIRPQLNLELDFISTTINSDNLKKALNRPKNESTTIATASQIFSLPVTSKKVLLVDDNQINLKLASELIGLWGHQVSEAEKALEAMALYQRDSFDLIVLDIQMPEIDGIQLLKMMRNAKPLDQTPIVAMTANILNDEPQRLLKLGFNYYLSKPVDEEKFRSILDGSGHISNSLTEQNQEQEFPKNSHDSKLSIDFEQSLKLSQNNKITLRKILNILISDVPILQLQLKSAALKNDRERLSAILHKLHGTTCYTSLPRLKQQIISWQKSIATCSNSQQQAIVLEVNEELDNIRNETQQLLKEMDNRS
jgi:two-component system sensor histidine kinase BarA